MFEYKRKYLLWILVSLITNNFNLAPTAHFLLEMKVAAFYIRVWFKIQPFLFPINFLIL